tara:strand:- start:215 stop:829 length:615 start_codon:yes stop_codon:yes gene_type:complete
VKSNKPDYYNDLDKTYIKIWKLLENGLSNRDNSFHIPIFICGTNNDFDGRIVVLRNLNKKNNSLCFHSDIRSIKIKTLKLNPKGTFLFYDKKEKIQLRVSCNIKIHYQNSTTYKSWNNTVHMSRQCYLGNKSPGSISLEATSGLSEDIDNSKYTMEESEAGYKNFCVVEAFISSIEWLYLASKGHRRAKFFIENNHVDKKWIIP